jgi:hypothetical protein
LRDLLAQKDVSRRQKLDCQPAVQMEFSRRIKLWKLDTCKRFLSIIRTPTGPPKPLFWTAYVPARICNYGFLILEREHFVDG